MGSLRLDDTDRGMDMDSLGAGISRDELEQLKMDAIICINDTLFKKLQEIDQVRANFFGQEMGEEGENLI